VTAGEPRERLLAAAVDHALAHGIGDISLRELAAAIGTSHRMLIYHFGSKEGLFVEVIRAVEAAQRAFLTELATEPGITPADSIRRIWRHLSDPALWPQERLFFEIYGQALQGRPGTVGVLDGIVDDWVEPAAEHAVPRGRAAAAARADARLSLAVVRGLLLDLLATGDRRGTDEALEHYAASLARRS
jgi:AcrR family transcriptional regulator